MRSRDEIERKLTSRVDQNIEIVWKREENI